jgi:hypothetical protein
VSERLAGQLVDESLVSLATNGSLAELARELAAARIPAGFVFSSNDRRFTRPLGDTGLGRTERLGSVLAALEQRRPDFRAYETRGVLLVMPAKSPCLAPLDRMISNLEVDNLPVTHALSIIRRHLDPFAPFGPPGLASTRTKSAEPAEREMPPLPAIARVTLRFARATVAEAFQQIAIQAPGVVWAVFENMSVSGEPRCSVDLYYAGGSLVTGLDILK